MIRILALVSIGLAGVAALSGCAATAAGVAAQPLPIRGSLAHPARVALPPDATAVVELRDTTSGEGPVVAEQRTGLGGKQAPIPFEFSVDRAKLNADRAYSVRGGVFAGGRPAWASDPVPIDAKEGVVDVGTLMMKPVRAEAFLSEFRCGDQALSVGYAQDRMRMTVANETFDMRRVPSGSGAKYEAVNDPTTTFWSRGRSALVEVKGRPYPECSLAGATPFRATGNEPFWRLDMARGQMTLTTDLGKTRVTAPTPAGERIEGGTRYAANTNEGPITVTVLDRRCGDTMTGMPHPNAVTVQFKGRTLAGCGGDPAALLQGREWVVEDINRTGVIDRSRVTLSFGADGSLVGMGSCNTYIARYALAGEGLAITRPASTMKACPSALMKQEDLFFDVLRKVQRFEIDPNGALILRSSDGRSITARRL